MCNDDKGRIIVSDQFGGCTGSPPAPGSSYGIGHRKGAGEDPGSQRVVGANGGCTWQSMITSANFPAAVSGDRFDGDDKLDKVVLPRDVCAR